MDEELEGRGRFGRGWQGEEKRVTLTSPFPEDRIQLDITSGFSRVAHVHGLRSR
jgi:hypothetical protein